jgi:hypothetical protein
MEMLTVKLKQKVIKMAKLTVKLTVKPMETLKEKQMEMLKEKLTETLMET